MSPTLTKKLLTADEFARLPEPSDGSRQELVRGEVVTMAPPNFNPGKIQVLVSFALQAFNRTANIGHVASETGVVTEEDPSTVRGPDVAFWNYSRLPEDSAPEVYAKVAPDLCVEVISPGNTRQEMRKRSVSISPAAFKWSGSSIRKIARSPFIAIQATGECSGMTQRSRARNCCQVSRARLLSFSPSESDERLDGRGRRAHR